MHYEIDKVGITNEMLYQAANMSVEELQAMQANLERGLEIPKAQGSAPRRVISTLIAHHVLLEKAEQSQKLPNAPLEAKILLVADVYDSLTSAKDAHLALGGDGAVSQRAGIEYDADVVEAMVKVFRKRGMQPGELSSPARH